MTSALTIANTFLAQGNKDGIDISPMKLQKLIYILYKEYLKKTRRGLFSDYFEVWKYGPVVPSVYNAFSNYGSKPIKSYYLNEDKSYTTIKLNSNKVFDSVFFDVWEKYKFKDGVFLSDLTHRSGTAWSVALSCGRKVLDDSDIFKEESYDKCLQ